MLDFIFYGFVKTTSDCFSFHVLHRKKFWFEKINNNGVFSMSYTLIFVVFRKTKQIVFSPCIILQFLWFCENNKRLIFFSMNYIEN
jgi:hypothetical protein